MLSPVSLNVYRAFAAIQDGYSGAKEMNCYRVYLARFFGIPFRKLGCGLLLRVTRPIRGSALKIFRQNRLFNAVMRTVRLSP